MSWQPIETAPKDGTRVWLYCPEDEPTQVVGEWIEGDGYALWAYVDACMRDVVPEGPSPTHWMPLPEGPK